MKGLFCFVLALLFSSGYSQDMSVWDKTYEGSMLGLHAVLSGTTTGTAWKASIDISGYPLAMEGTIAGTQCTGTMSDDQTQSTLPFTADYLDGQITIAIRDINPLSGQVEDMQFVFMQSTTEQSPATTTTTPSASSDKLDQALIGQWRYTETYVSGDFSVATDYFMQFKPDGIIYVTDGRTAGGDISSSFDTSAGDLHRGVWKTENRVLWVNDGNSGWQPYAQYYAERSRMMLTFGDGKKQVWERL